MPAEPQDVQKQTDRDLLVGLNKDVGFVAENQKKLEALVSAKFDRLEERVTAVERAQDRQAGGINLGKWVIGAIGVAPLVAGLTGYYMGGGG